MADDIDLDALQHSGPFPADPQGSYPTLHDWRPVRVGSAICLTGSVRGHGRLLDGEIRTSALRAIACDRSWAKTVNTLYLLGEQAAESTSADEALPPLPLLLQVMLADTWIRAAKIVVDATMDHRPLLDQQAHSDFCEVWLNADAMPVHEGQRRAAAVHSRIRCDAACGGGRMAGARGRNFVARHLHVDRKGRLRSIRQKICDGR